MAFLDDLKQQQQQQNHEEENGERSLPRWPHHPVPLTVISGGLPLPLWS